MSYFAQEDHSNNATRQERDIYDNMWTILHWILDRLQPRRAIETNTLRQSLRFRTPHAQLSSAEKKRPEYILHAKRHPKRQPHATTAARVVVIIVFLRLVVQMEGLALVVVFNPMFGVFRS